MSIQSDPAPAPAPAPAPSNSLVDDGMRQVARQLSALFSQAIHAANVEVDALIQRRERDTQRIDHQLDHMLGFCCDPDMLLAFKRLCRYYYGIDPVATFEHINAYREMWDTPDEQDDVAGGGV
jgi:hypothetical protein